MFLTNMYTLDLMHMHLHNDHMDIYDFCFDASCFGYCDNALFIRPLTCMYSL